MVIILIDLDLLLGAQRLDPYPYQSTPVPLSFLKDNA
jgi:hypothetical protein